MIKLNKELKIKIIIFAIISILICSSFFFYSGCENFVNNIFFPTPINQTKDCELRVHFIDVGQGDSILIELPDNKTMLIDAGPSSQEDELILYLNKIFENKENKDIDYFVLTHPDEDHIGGADVVFDNYNVKFCYRPSVFTNDEVLNFGFVDVEINSEPHFETAITKMYQENCESIVTFATDNLLNLKSDCPYSIKFLAPIEERYTNSNDYSAVIMLEYKNKKFLFTGDAGSNIEQSLVSLYKDELKADVLKVAHHGSNDSSSFDFLKYVKPKFAVIQVGINNLYNLPNKDALNRISACMGNKNILRTDTNGNIIIGVNSNKEIVIECAKNHIVEIHINWWCVVLFIECLSFIIIFSIKIKSKQDK